MFRTRKFLKANFADHHALVALIASYGLHPPLADTAYKWFLRGSVPPDRLMLLLALLEMERGKPVSVAEYVDMPK